MKKYFLILVSLLAFFLATPGAYAQQNGTTLSADKTATAHDTTTYAWTIDKSVTPATWNLFKGDSGTSEYTVALTKDGGTNTGYIDGQICVTNGGSVATTGLSITDNVTMPPDDTVIASTSVDVSAHPTLNPDETYCYPYHVDISSPVLGDNYKDTAYVTITNHSGHLGDNFGPHPSATSVMPNSPTLVNDTVNVSDTNGESWQFSGSGSQSYEKTFSCDGDQGTHDNTATIDETSQHDSASVTVNCYDPTVTKTAHTTFDRLYHWDIAKVADQTNLTLAKNEVFPVNYTITPSATFTDSNWAVSGTITVHNPAPIAATINSVSDVISGPVTGSVSCGVTFPYTLAAESDLICSYTAALPDATTRTNTATAIQQNYSYDKDGTPTEDGTTDYTGTASVNFGSATISETDKCATVSDTFGLSLGTVCFGDLPKLYTYSHDIGPYTDCGNHDVTNTATIITNDTSTTDTASWTVHANIPCPLGCTLTIGYWKNHSGKQKGPQSDNVTPLLSQCLGNKTLLLFCGLGTLSVNVNSSSIAYQILSMSYSGGTSSNGITKLYSQLLAAKLNIQNGASNAVATTISAADLFLTTHNQSSWSSLSKSQQQQVLGWMSTLDNYNNGLTSVPHCSQ